MEYLLLKRKRMNKRKRNLKCSKVELNSTNNNSQNVIKGGKNYD